MWDLASRLKSYTESGSTTSFTYDGFGMRVSRTSGGTTRQYIWNYAFALPSISIVQRGGSDLRYYIHLPNGRLLHSIEASDNRRRFFHFDEMGTTVFLTNNGGTITDTYGITPYGQVTATTGATDNPFTFIGAYGVMQEGESGLYYMRARYYDSVSSRFFSRDPVESISPNQTNPYQYASCSPLHYEDPRGLQEGTAPDWANKAGGVGLGMNTTLGGVNGLTCRTYISPLIGIELTFGFGFGGMSCDPETGNRESINVKPLFRFGFEGLSCFNCPGCGKCILPSDMDGDISSNGLGPKSPVVNSFYVPYLLETTGTGGGAYNGDVFLMNTTSSDISVEVFLYNLDGTSLVAASPASLPAGATTIVSVDAFLGAISGTRHANMMITSADANFSGENIAAFAAIARFLPGGGTAGYTISTLWKAE
jgi:RHS repeat-associated protein